jgi:hypothetical protein
MAHRGSATSPFRHDATATPRDFLHATPRAGGVSFSSDIHGRDLDPDGAQGHASKSAAEMHTLRCPCRPAVAQCLRQASLRQQCRVLTRVRGGRSIQTARAVVASERQRLLSKTQLGGEKEWSPSQSFEPAKRASEEQLFEEVGLLMQERDLLLREKSALQAILSSSE